MCTKKKSCLVIHFSKSHQTTKGRDDVSVVRQDGGERQRLAERRVILQLFKQSSGLSDFPC